ncbi:MAG: cobalamin-binding protein, partial [Nocardioides sp.]|nr:cobalamin-binding protein [Nocardioides sp.]
AARPDVVVAAPCGFDRAGSEELAARVRSSGELPGIEVYAVDANASWARAATRNVDGVRELSELLHPVDRVGAT